MNHTGLIINASNTNGTTQPFSLGNPVSVSRRVLFQPEIVSTNGFCLPKIAMETLRVEDQFIGAVAQGGSCNVDILHYVPHGLTHIETSAHVLPLNADSFCLDKASPEQAIGLTYLLDLAQEDFSQSNQIPWEPIKAKLDKIDWVVSLLAIKTKASLLPWDHDFSGQDFLSLSPEAARGIHEYRGRVGGSSLREQRIDTLILDLPSIDPESDGGKLLAHRSFFGLPSAGYDCVDTEFRLLVELAWFNTLAEGYYYTMITPPRFQTHAMCTDILFFPLT